MTLQCVPSAKRAQAGDKIASVPAPLELYRENCQDEDGTRYTVISRISAPQTLCSKTELRCASSTIACSLAPPKLSVMLDGVAGSTDREERGIKGVHGEAAVTVLRAEIVQLRALKA